MLQHWATLTQIEMTVDDERGRLTDFQVVYFFTLITL